MKFFVSSRMDELFIARKTAIETIHNEGHTPLYIETEPDDRARAKKTMDMLVEDADGLVSIHYISLGNFESLLGDHTPTQYELIRFVKRHPDAPVLFFRQMADADTPVSGSMIRFFEEYAKEREVQIIKFQGQQELATKLTKALDPYKERIDKKEAKARLIVRYVGPDFIGLIAKVSEIIFTGHKLNIDYISHAAKAGRATWYITCSPREGHGSKKSPNIDRLKRDLKNGVRRDLELAIDEGRLVDGAESAMHPEIKVEKDTTSRQAFEFFVEVRTIDSPGQLNAICKVLRERSYNIDELQLRPTSYGYGRQTTIIMWLSKSCVRSQYKEITKELRELEACLQYLVGVRAFSIQPLDIDRLPRGVT